MSTHHLLPSLVALTLSLGAAGCSSVAKKAEPAPLNATAELDGKCQSVGDYGMPLVVDWEPQDRTNLAEAMYEGVPVFKYTCGSLQRLRGCSIAGTYGFLSLPREDKVLELTTVDELRTNLPLGGLIGKVESALERGASLNIATAIVGKRRTTLDGVPRAALHGGAACAGATHFLKGTFVGAFAMEVGTRGAAATTVGVFASASGESSRLMRHRSGSLDACDHLREGELTPGCDAVSRLELLALDAPIIEQSPEKSGALVLSPCPEGLVYSDGKCARPAAGQAYLCRPNNVSECQEQCRRGDAPSCNNLAIAHLNGQGVDEDPLLAGGLLQQACDKGLLRACFNVGLLYQSGKGVPQDSARASRLLEQACSGGEQVACTVLALVWIAGQAAQGGQPNLTRAVELFTTGCNGGFSLACMGLASLYGMPGGPPADPFRQAALYQKACDGYAPACSTLGGVYEAGILAPKDLARAKSLYAQACKRGDQPGCVALERIKEGRARATQAPTSLIPQVEAAPIAEPAPDEDSEERSDGQRLLLRGGIEFVPGTARLKADAATAQVLEQVHRFMSTDPSMTLVRVEGHTSNVGDPKANLNLSAQRALEVKRRLVAQGIAPGRLIAVGFGQNLPIADNSTPPGQSKNVRIEFVIVVRGGRQLVKDVTGGGRRAD